MAAQFVLYRFKPGPDLQASLHLCYSKHPAAPVFPNSSRKARTKGASARPAGPAPSSGSAAVSCLHGEVKTSNQAGVVGGGISPTAEHLCRNPPEQEAGGEEHSHAPSKLLHHYSCSKERRGAKSRYGGRGPKSFTRQQFKAGNESVG